MTTSNNNNLKFLDLLTIGSTGLSIYNTILNEKQITNDELLDLVLKELKNDLQEQNIVLLENIKKILRGEIMEFFSKILEKGKSEDIQELKDIFSNMQEEVKKSNPSLFNNIEAEMYEMAEGKVLTKEMAEKWVHSMKPYAEHWNFETTEQVRNSTNSSNLDPVRFYTSMNRMWNDYHDSISKVYSEIAEEPTLYIALTKGWINDIDAVEGKDYLYKKYITKE